MPWHAVVFGRFAPGTACPLQGQKCHFHAFEQLVPLWGFRALQGQKCNLHVFKQFVLLRGFHLRSAKNALSQLRQHPR